MRIKMKANIEHSRVADRLFLLPSLSIISHLFEPSLLHPSPPSQTGLLIESERVYAGFEKHFFFSISKPLISQADESWDKEESAEWNSVKLAFAALVFAQLQAEDLCPTPPPPPTPPAWQPASLSQGGCKAAQSELSFSSSSPLAAVPLLLEERRGEVCIHAHKCLICIVSGLAAVIGTRSLKYSIK